jgi:subtilase family serine protease
MVDLLAAIPRSTTVPTWSGLGRSRGSTMKPRSSRFVSVAALLAIPLLSITPPTSAVAVGSRGDAPDPLVEAACGPVPVGQARCHALRYTPVSGGLGLQAVQPRGLSPADIQSAYQLPKSGGQTVAIVDAYDDPNAEQDLAVYRQQFNLPACTSDNGCFRKVDEQGGSNYPPADANWSAEISLDLDAVSAACPGCKILLVEAGSNQDANLYGAVDQAVTLGANFVSNSWSEAEKASQRSSDQHWDVPGVLFAFATGDNGYSAGTQYPASAATALAVGGTSLTKGGGGRGWTETAWTGAGSGCSRYEAKPSWQSGAVTPCRSHRAEADVSAVANPKTGLAIYDSYQKDGWLQYGGTSLATPLITAIAALAGPGGGASNPASYPYAHPANLTDITSGSNGYCRTAVCDAGPGWDGPTGLGTPLGVTAFTPGTVAAHRP